MVECLLAKENVASSNLVSRSIYTSGKRETSITQDIARMTDTDDLTKKLAAANDALLRRAMKRLLKEDIVREDFEIDLKPKPAEEKPNASPSP